MIMHGMRRTFLVALLTVFAVGLAVVSSAGAVTPAPGLQLLGNAAPTNLPPGGEGIVSIQIFNNGAQVASPGAVVTDILPSDLTPTGHTLRWYGSSPDGECGTLIGQEVKCELPFPIGREPVQVNIVVKVNPDAQGSTIDRALITGGGALRRTSIAFPVTFGTGTPPAGFAHLEGWLTNADGSTDTQAGSHPYDLTVAFELNNVIKTAGKLSPSFGGGTVAGGELRNLNVNLPPGIVGNPEAIPQCNRRELDSGLGLSCPVATQIGINYPSVGEITNAQSTPVYNMVPPPGVAAQFAFNTLGHLVYLNSGVRTGGDNGITVHADDLPETGITGDTTVIWGVPGEANHNKERRGTLNGTECGREEESCPVSGPVKPFLTLPTSCQDSEPEITEEYLGSWHDENYVGQPAHLRLHDNEDNPVGFTDCELLQPFKPAVTIAPDTTYADTPAGLSVDVKMPEGLNPDGLETPNLKNTVVTLPEGIVINPGQATGLVACQLSQEALGSLPDGEINEGPASCPLASKVGTDEITTPLLPNKLQGDVYVLGQNPPNMGLLITASGEGVNLKIVASVHLNEQTGQLVTTVDNTPDFPFTDFKLAFSGGAQAALATPTGCGTYESSADFAPWASPFIEEAFDSSRFQITAGPNGTPCVSPMPFAPTMTAGATTDQAGGYTSFTMLLQRGDEQQRIKNLSFRTPEGLLGMISKVPLCQEPQAAQGTCSAASQIGHTVVGVGPGPYPFYIPQASAPPAPIYLTGPYKGAPFGLSIVVPLIAGPFNLGTEIVRTTIDVDPHTSQITITTDPFPLTVKGIPTDIRLINAVIDRREFMFNPTSCAPQSFSGTATSFEGASAPLESHFQMGSCQALKFQPNFKVSTTGKTSRVNGASLTVKIVYPVGNLGDNQASSQSNIKSVKVDLPKQLPSRLTTLQKACTAATFEANPANCPAASIVGHAKAITPVLPVPIEGPTYFVSHAGEEFPSLIAVLQGYGVTVDLVGSTFINSKTNITSSTFKNVPDVPIASFELNLPQGKYSALAANGNLCKTKLTMPTAFTGQDGAVIHQSTAISVTGCPKIKAKKAKKRKGAGSSQKAKKK